MILLRALFYTFLFFLFYGLVKVAVLAWRFRDIIKQIRKGHTNGQSGFGTWTYTRYNTSSQRQDASEPKETVSQGTAKPRKRIISDDEGEYVDFEEV